jgi:hypothetical protein
MGMFRKTLNDAENAIRKNRFQTAADIVVKHIETEHALNSDANRLIRDVVLFQENLRDLQIILGTLVKSRAPAKLKNSALELIESAKRNVSVLIMQCEKVLKDEKEET